MRVRDACRKTGYGTADFERELSTCFVKSDVWYRVSLNQTHPSLKAGEFATALDGFVRMVKT